MHPFFGHFDSALVGISNNSNGAKQVFLDTPVLGSYLRWEFLKCTPFQVVHKDREV